MGKVPGKGVFSPPYLFNLYSEYTMRQANLEEIDVGVRMGGRKRNNLRYADDTTLLAESKEELLQLVTSVKEKSAQAGLYLNLKKTKEIVQDFVFLGAKIEDSGSCKGEILRRLALGRAAMTGLNKIIMERQSYTNDNKMPNSKCISFPSSAVWLWIQDDKKSREKKS